MHYIFLYVATLPMLGHRIRMKGKTGSIKNVRNYFQNKKSNSKGERGIVVMYRL